MNHLTLSQHFYASGPAGLTGKRGLQTIATSADLSADAARQQLEAHCRFYPVKGIPEHENPVNWGWFELEGQKACLHRIGYSGNDDEGRPGNFCAHNLVVDMAGLEAIDFDIVALMDWVRRESPVRYRYPRSGIEDGFVRRHDQLYEVYGKTRETLTKVPPLQAPLSQIRATRDRLDNDIHGQIVPELIAALGADRVTAIVRSAIRAAGDRQPLVVRGIRDGKRESTLEWNLCSLLFSFYPAHVRKHLTFSTFHEAPDDVAMQARAPSAKPIRHSVLRVVFHPLAAAAPGMNASPPQQLIRTDQPPPNVVTLSNVVDHFARALPGPENTWPLLVHQRNLASLFEWSEEAPGIESSYQIYGRVDNAGKSAIGRQDYEFLHLAAMHLRRSSRALLNLVQRLVDQFIQICGQAPAPLSRLAQDVGAILSGPTDQAGSPPLCQTLSAGEAQGILGPLFQYSLLLSDQGVLKGLLEFAASPRFAVEVRGVLRDEFATRFEKYVRKYSTDAALGFWQTIRSCQKAGTVDFGSSLDRAESTLVGRVVEESEKSVAGTEVDQRAVDLLLSAPAQDVDQLARRLVLVIKLFRKLSAADTVVRVTNELDQLVRKGLLPIEWLQSLLASRRDLAFAAYPCWLELAARHTQLEPDVRRALSSCTLLAEYWRCPDDLHGQLLHESFRRCLLNQQADWPAALAKVGPLYVQEGAKGLGDRLSRLGRELAAGFDSQVYDVHLNWLRFADEFARQLQDSQAADHCRRAARQHLLKVCSVLAESAAWQPAIWKQHAATLEALVALSADEESLALDFFNLGRDIANRRNELLLPEQAAPVGDCLRQALSQFGQATTADGQQAFWLAHLVYLGCTSSEKEWLRIRAYAAIETLLAVPAAAPGSPTRFHEYFGNICTRKIWKWIVTERLAKDCNVDRADYGSWERWFGAKGERRQLVSALSTQRAAPNDPSLLDEFWNSAFGDHNRVSNAGACYVTSYLLSLPPALPAVTSLARNTLKFALRQHVDDLLAEANRLSQQRYLPSPPNQPTGQFQQKMFEMRSVFELDDIPLDHERIKSFLQWMGVCLANATHTNLLTYCPMLGNLARKLDSCDVTGNTALWEAVFKWLCRDELAGCFGHRPETLAATFVAIGEQILRLPAAHAGALASAGGLNNINRARMWPSPRPASLFSRLRKSQEKDPQVAAFKGKVGGDPVRLKARGRFAACCYGDADIRLAEIFLAFSEHASADGSKRLGHALAGYALLEGNRDECLRRQTGKLQKKPFRSRLLKEFKRKEWPDVTEAFRASLEEEGVPGKTAAELAQSLR